MASNYARLIADHVVIKSEDKKWAKQAEAVQRILRFHLHNNEEIQKVFNNNIQRQLLLMVKELLEGDYEGKIKNRTDTKQ